MRVTSHDRDSSDRFGVGFVSGVIATVLAAAFIRGAMWLAEWAAGRSLTEIAVAFQQGLHTPVLSVMDVAGTVLIVLVLFIVIQMPRYMGGGA